MNDWFRSWHGAPTDTKWLGIARKAGVAPGIVVAVAWALMDRASSAEDRGSIEGYDAEGLAYFFGCEPEEVEAIILAMAEKGMIENSRLTSWEKRQPKREDPNASERAKNWREKKKTNAKPNEPERDQTQTNASEHNRTTDTDKTREDKKDKGFSYRARDAAPEQTGDLASHGHFEEFWAVYPNKVNEVGARRAFPFACLRASPTEIIAGATRYASKQDDSAWMNPVNWLDGDRWKDQPAQPPPKRGRENPRMTEKRSAISDFLKDGNDEQRHESSFNGDVLMLSAKPGH